jgi:hypothetical protein
MNWWPMGVGDAPPPAAVATETLEGAALEALIDGDGDLARGLVDQLNPDEAERVVAAAARLASMAADVVSRQCRSHLRVID